MGYLASFQLKWFVTVEKYLVSYDELRVSRCDVGTTTGKRPLVA